MGDCWPTQTSSSSHYGEGTNLLESQKKQQEEEIRSKKSCYGGCFTSSMARWAAATLVLLVVALALNHGSPQTRRHGHTARSHHSSDSLQKVAAAATKASSKYSRVQGVGFQIYTGGAPAYIEDPQGGASIPNPECTTHSSYGQHETDTVPVIQCYLGDDNPVTDVVMRLNVMKDAVETAFLQVNQDPSVLKVFVAPEFFWRGPNGAYIFGDEDFGNDKVCGPICKILVELEDFIAQKRFENWIFLFGTVIAYEKLPKEDTFDYLFYNFAPVYKGYDPTKMDHTGKKFLLPKRYVSSSDFLTPRRHLNSSLFEELIGDDAMQRRDTTIRNPFDYKQKRYNDHVWADYKTELTDLGYTMIEYDWLMIDGLSVSLEICFDHQMRTALNTYLGDMVTGRHTYIPSSSDGLLSYTQIPDYQAQISIVSSAGMTVVADSLALTNNGVMFLQDGLSNDTQRQFVSTDDCDSGIQFEGGLEGVKRDVVMTHTDVSFEYTLLANPRAVSINRDVRPVFSEQVYHPLVNVFEAVDIAKVHPAKTKPN